MKAIEFLRISSISFGLALILAEAPVVRAGEGHAIIGSVAIDAASTPEQHKALADHYRSEADAARKAAKSHKAMKDSYEVVRRGTSVGAHMEKHCDNLIQTYESQASDYDAMAAEHDALAAKAAAGK